MSRATIVLTLATALLLGLAATPAEAADVGCGGPNVEVCVPVCIDGPCPPYACIHPARPDIDVCVRP